MILNRKDLGEALLSVVVGAIFVGCAFWFRSKIESHIGQTATSWVLRILVLLYVLALASKLSESVDFLVREYTERKRKRDDEREQAKLDAEERKEWAEYRAFLNWAGQNRKTVDHLLAIVEREQIEDPEHLSYLIERREREGPSGLTDLPRLFEWLKARRELQKFGIEPPLPSL
jgi:hypothetical protein